ncbi:CocE/NonD family hydrolase C-terminal non-catalytic domain-containing protein [Streptomyces massasporeus]|uniref:CocE/NonD family hydrolase C-terminal non-catalytic domain-containing protein n=1 Tax=Streptomyces massasporeus TaxID=67324 RepID=UPI0036D0A49C
MAGTVQDTSRLVCYGEGVPGDTGCAYRLRWAMQPQDYVVEKGHRLGVVLISTDHDYTLRHPPGTRMTVRTGLSSVTLPVAPPAGS